MGGKVIGAFLGLLLAAAGAPAAMAAAVTEEEAHAIGVNAYLYFYSPVTMDVTRKQLTNHRSRARARRADEYLCQCSCLSHGRHEGRRAAEFRYPLFQRLARSHQGASDRLGPRYRRPLLSPADARHVDGRVRVARLAHHGNAGRQFPRRPPGWRPDCARIHRGIQAAEAPSASMRRRLMCGSSAAPRPTAQPTMTPSTKSRLATRSRRSPNGARQPKPAEVKIDPEHRHEDAAEDPGRHHASGQVLRLRGRTPQTAAASYHG